MRKLVAEKISQESALFRNNEVVWAKLEASPSFLILSRSRKIPVPVQA